MSNPQSDRKLVLVAEDNPDTRELLEYALEGAPFDTVFASDGQEALDCFHAALEGERPIAFALLDIEMPKVSGFLAAEQMLERDRSIRVVLCTAYNLQEVLPRARQTGVAEVWLKPFAMEKLTRRINCALGD